jgi:kinesin family protein 2/24
MASSAALTTTHLPTLRTLLAEWEQAQPPSTGFQTALDAKVSPESLKEIFVAFRTRPPLPNEAAEKFTASEAEEPVDSTDERAIPGATESIEEGLDKVIAKLGVSEEETNYCRGVSVPSAEPGVFVVHTPGYKVGSKQEDMVLLV